MTAETLEICSLYCAILEVSSLIRAVIELRLPLMLVFCCWNWADRLLKRLASASALLNNSWREASSVGLLAALCKAEKKLVSAPVIPVLLSDNKLLSGVT
ncbi:hypothetical protein D3C81_1486920 [compost metagenome]